MTTESLSINAEISRLFSIMFYNPEETFLSEPETVKALAELIKEKDASFRDDAEKLVNSLKELDAQELMLDYAALFVGPFQLQAPPYGSVYLDVAKTVNGESTAAVTDIYRKFALNVKPDMREPADHIAIELEFIHTALITIGNMKAENKDTTETENVFNDFISDYYHPFVSRMCELIEKNASTDFYKSIGGLLKTFSDELKLVQV
ncbi:cytoplasmic chaperone TorD family protein [Denitrovibrio acetiphilus DSM 12809]|uniref:Cytoplasmic chaperone TorD family protein n=1 Tax=Denitrovibrio acetiphilus (strain DSM 12809 / NBRC 114555 / N2460) TaxID=522772 RepID=D4H294_DENA2|nr:molecular chaperone TorD family protein [Denitrovibrio acetiphilus]ADD68885.1 cytoplasmic chaperone TorD family protein [Denitrovibrio acetiphilus DSM 12809]